MSETERLLTQAQDVASRAFGSPSQENEMNASHPDAGPGAL